MEEWDKHLDEMRQTRRDSIIIAAEKVFLKSDINRTTMKDIAAESGISRVTLYKYFKTIDEVAIQVLIRIITLLKEEITQLIDPNQTPLDVFRSFTHCYIEIAEKYPDHIRFTAFFDHYFREDYPDEKSELLLEELFFGSSGIDELIVAGQKDGSIDPDLDPWETSRLISNTLQSLIQKAIVRGGIITKIQKIDPFMQVRDMADIFIKHISS